MSERPPLAETRFDGSEASGQVQGRASDPTRPEPAVPVPAWQDPQLITVAVILCEPGHAAAWVVRATGRQYCETCLSKAQVMQAADLLADPR